MNLGYYDIDYNYPIWYKSWKSINYHYLVSVEFSQRLITHYTLAIL